MDFEGLLGSLFVLYILGAMVMGFLRRGRRPGSEDGGDPGRPGFPQVLDLEELEERLRDLAAGRRPGEEPSSFEPGPQVEPEPQAEPGPSAPAPAPPAVVTARIPAVVPAPVRSDQDWEGEDEWADLEDGIWSEPSAVPARGTTSGRTLPPAATSLLDRDNPWQAAFIIKEVLGPPRALNPHRGRPPF